MTVMKVGNRDQTALEKAVRVAKPAFGHAIFLGLFINILALVAPLYMMQVYGRVIMSRNMTTLLMLTLVAGALLVSYALLEAARSRMLVRAGILFDRQSSNQVFDSVQRSNIINVGDGSSQGLRDLDPDAKDFGVIDPVPCLEAFFGQHLQPDTGSAGQ